MSKTALGRGLGALLGSNPNKPASPPALPSEPQSAIPGQEQVQKIPLSKIRPCSFQPRKDFSPEAIAELADSIREQGIIQPLIVRPHDDHFEIIAGERRWRAAQQAGLQELPVIVRTANDREVLELALIENLQRENLNAIEEATGYQQLIDQFQLTQEQAAQKVGKSRALVANALRLLKLGQDIQNFVRQGQLSVGHAKVILGLPTGTEQRSAAEKVLKNRLSVRQTEELVTALLAPKNNSSRANPSEAPPKKDLHVTDLENKLRERFGTKVQLRYKQGKGAIEIKFFNDDDLDRILKISGVNAD